MCEWWMFLLFHERSRKQGHHLRVRMGKEALQICMTGLLFPGCCSVPQTHRLQLVHPTGFWYTQTDMNPSNGVNLGWCWDSHPHFSFLFIVTLQFLSFPSSLTCWDWALLFLKFYTPGSSSLAALIQTLEEALFIHPCGLIGLYETCSL